MAPLEVQEMAKTLQNLENMHDAPKNIERDRSKTKRLFHEHLTTIDLTGNFF